MMRTKEATIIKLEDDILISSWENLEEIAEEYGTDTDIWVEVTDHSGLLDVFSIEIDENDFNVTDEVEATKLFLENNGFTVDIDANLDFFKDEKLMFIFFYNGNNLRKISEFETAYNEIALSSDHRDIEDLEFVPTYSKEQDYITDRYIPKSLPGFKKFAKITDSSDSHESTWTFNSLNGIKNLIELLKADPDLIAHFRD